MITISLCMIVKNEEAVLARCLDSFHAAADEIIIVDTGSDDRTKEIAARYTDKLYDFPWNNDFSAARNFAFSKSSCDYILSCDADEVIDGENLLRLERLKAILLPEIEIVQMKYRESLPISEHVLNARQEYRPKLFRRIRTFHWIDPVHETVRTEPVVYNSDIVIDHRPTAGHSSRDFSLFLNAYRRDHFLSPRIFSMYAKELWRYGSLNDLKNASEIFLHALHQTEDNGQRYETDHLMEASVLLAKYFRKSGDDASFMKYTLKVLVTSPDSEICLELGKYYLKRGDFEESSLWFENAAEQTEPLLDVHAGGDTALSLWAESLKKEAGAVHDSTRAKELLKLSDEKKSLADQWELPEED